jgi:hypothetical protein
MRKIALKHARYFPKKDRARYAYKVRKYLYGEHLRRAFAWLPFNEAFRELRHAIKRAFKRALTYKKERQ